MREKSAHGGASPPNEGWRLPLWAMWPRPRAAETRSENLQTSRFLGLTGGFEHELSGLRHDMHGVIDALEHEIAARNVAGTAG